LDSSVNCAKFARQLYNLRHVLENEEETGNTGEQMQELQNMIAKHDKEHPMKTFNTEGTGARDCVELGAHGYEVQPRVIEDENGIWELFSNVRQPVSTYAPR
jgi:hypothetical protein